VKLIRITGSRLAHVHLKDVDRGGKKPAEPNSLADVPYVLASHSFGGQYILTFAATCPDQVAGMVLLRVRSAISARRSAMSAASASAGLPPRSAAPRRAVIGSAAVALVVSSAGSTTRVPWTMFMPQAKPKVPARSGRSRTVVFGARVGRR
jgi:pimeloyl-ACP methyl ester carboxylesterase